MIARASHAHVLYRDENSTVYHYLEEATRSTSYAASIKPFQRRKDGRGAWLAILAQYAGRDKWEAEIKKQEQLLHTRIWKGQTNFSLEHFISQHRNAYVSMQACAEHVQYQLPNEYSRVGFLLDAIQCSDAGLQAAMASVRTDHTANGMRNNFETAAAHLQTYDPVANKRAANSSGKRSNALVSTAEGDGKEVEVSGTIGKPSIGKTGVHLRFHKPSEYKYLTKEQKQELRQWLIDNPDVVKKLKTTSPQKKVKFNKKNISTMIVKQVQTALKEAVKEEEEATNEEAYIYALIDAALQKKEAASASISKYDEPKQKVTLKSILKRAQNSASKSS